MNKKLSKREKEVLRIMSDGYTSASIANYFGISVRTIDAHRSNLMKKLGAKNGEHAIRLAIENGDLKIAHPPYNCKAEWQDKDNADVRKLIKKWNPEPVTVNKQINYEQ